MFKVRFEGGAELAKTLDQLKLGQQKNLVREALKSGAEPIRSHAAGVAPRAPGAPDIADNIVISTARVTSERANSGDIAAVKIGPARGFAYGLPLELGTVHHGAQPFMRPAFDAKHIVALREIGSEMWRFLAAKGAHRKATVDAGLEDSAFQDTGAGLGAGTFQPSARRRGGS